MLQTTSIVARQQWTWVVLNQLLCGAVLLLQADVYERLDALDSDTTEARAASILHGLGFDKEMQVCVVGFCFLILGVGEETPRRIDF